MKGRSLFWGYVAAAVLATLSYINSLDGDFVHDDIPAIAANPDATGYSPIIDLFKNDFWGTSINDPSSHMSYRPLTILTFRINHWLGGLNPKGFHIFNIMLHITCTLLFIRVAYGIIHLHRKFAIAAGFMFAVHPIHTEAVSGIVGRADVLACFLFLLSFLVYHDNTWFKNRDKVFWSVILSFMSMLAKETGLTVLIINLVFDLYKSWPLLKRTFIQSKWNEDALKFVRRAAKLFIAMSVMLMIRLGVQRGSMPTFSSRDNPAAFHPSLPVRIMTYSYLAVLNMWLVLCPVTLSHDWQMGSIPLITSAADRRNLATITGFTILVLLTYKSMLDTHAVKESSVFLSILFMVVPFVPASNLIITVGFVIAERILYMPSMGMILLLCVGLQEIMRRTTYKKLISLGFLMLLICFTCRTVMRNRDWTSRESLARAGLKALPNNAKMHYNMANYLRDAGKPEFAVLHYREAIRLWPTYACAHNNLGTLMRRGADAEIYFKNAISISPVHVNAHYNLGQVYRRLNRTQEAVAMLERCISLNKGYTAAYLLLAKLSTGFKVGKCLQTVTCLHPNHPEYLAEYADWLLTQARPTEAYLYYEKALRSKSVTGLNPILGAARALRAKGQTSRLHQLLIRWQVKMRKFKNIGQPSLVYTGDLYVRSFEHYHTASGQQWKSKRLEVVIRSQPEEEKEMQIVKPEPKKKKITTDQQIEQPTVFRSSDSKQCNKVPAKTGRKTKLRDVGWNVTEDSRLPNSTSLQQCLVMELRVDRKTP